MYWYMIPGEQKRIVRTYMMILGAGGDGYNIRRTHEYDSSLGDAIRDTRYCSCPRWNAFERCSQFVLSFFFCEVAVGVGGSDERNQSAPIQTAPQQVGFGSDRDSAGYRYSWIVVMAQDENQQPPPRIQYLSYCLSILQSIFVTTGVLLHCCSSLQRWVSTTHRSYSQLTFFIKKFSWSYGWH